MNLHDALFNWLQIKRVSEARPDDKAAKDTLDFFAVILEEDHQLADVQVAQIDDTMYHVQYKEAGEMKTQKFPRELTDKLLEDINSNPKYNE